IDLHRSVDTALRVAIIGISQRVAVGIVIGGQLRFDIRQRNIASDSHVQSIGDFWEIKVCVDHYGVESVGPVLCQKLVAENTHGGSEAIIQPINAGDAKPPVEMIFLNRVDKSLDIQCSLIELKGIWYLVISRRQIPIGAEFSARGAYVEACVYPAVDLDLR